MHKLIMCNYFFISTSRGTLGSVRGTPGYRGTPVGNHCYRTIGITSLVPLCCARVTVGHVHTLPRYVNTKHQNSCRGEYISVLQINYTGRFIMFSVIANFYSKKKILRTYLNGIVHNHRKTEKVFFRQLEMFDVCTTGDTAHIDTIFKFLPHTRQYGCINILHCCNYSCLKAFLLYS
jgi:hypothetical protein